MSKRLRSSEMCADCSGPGESHRPSPLPSALLPGTPAPRRPRWSGGSWRPSPAPHVPGVATRSNWGSLGARTVLGLSQPGGQGAAALGSLRSLPSQALRSGGGLEAGQRIPQEGAWAMHRKASYRSRVRMSSPPRARRRRCHLPCPGTPAARARRPAGNPARGGDLRRFPPPNQPANLRTTLRS